MKIERGINVKTKYYMDYRVNGIPCLFELYLFINPLSQRSLKSEHDIMRIYHRILDHIDLHIIPFIDIRLIDHYLKQECVFNDERLTKEELIKKLYLSSLAFKAANIQSKKKGREYLMSIQKGFSHSLKSLNENSLLDLAKSIGLDCDLFKKDLQSKLVRRLYLRDQSTARMLDVCQTPTLIIYEHQTGSTEYLTNKDITISNVLNILDDFSLRNYHHSQNSEAIIKTETNNHLKLVYSKD